MFDLDVWDYISSLGFESLGIDRVFHSVLSEEPNFSFIGFWAASLLPPSFVFVPAFEI